MERIKNGKYVRYRVTHFDGHRQRIVLSGMGKVVGTSKGRYKIERINGGMAIISPWNITEVL